MHKSEILSAIKGGLIVSCQALPGEVFYCEEKSLMPYFARAAELGGACGLRANSLRDIQAIREVSKLPLIGIIKQDYSDSPIYISPTLTEISVLHNLDCEIIAFDGTLRKRPGGEELVSFLKRIREAFPDQVFMADCSDFEEARVCAEAGIDLIGTTLSGYTDYTTDRQGVPYELIERLVHELDVPIIAEGHIDRPEALRQVLELGAHAAVVGSAITRPFEIVKSYIAAIK
ncbi:MAG: N-acetylmannosamine-6-phosphate 2-epimerase [Eubacteriales bacterium]|nr:N-acetylmannosamine-6-phosphate 2-epimerase [Eubacteriales bacterium]